MKDIYTCITAAAICLTMLLCLLVCGTCAASANTSRSILIIKGGNLWLYTPHSGSHPIQLTHGMDFDRLVPGPTGIALLSNDAGDRGLWEYSGKGVHRLADGGFGAPIRIAPDALIAGRVSLKTDEDDGLWLIRPTQQSPRVIGPENGSCQ